MELRNSFTIFYIYLKMTISYKTSNRRNPGMIQIKKLSFVMFLAISLASTLFGNIRAVESKKATIKLLNDGRFPTTFYWCSSSQSGDGVCHKKKVSPRKKVSYTFTKKQLQGDLSIIAIVHFKGPLSDKVQASIMKIRQKKSTTVPLRDILEFGQAAYINKDQIESVLPN